MYRALASLSWRAIRFLNLGALMLQLHPSSILVSTGWRRSFRRSQSVGPADEPLPWATYPFLRFIAGRLDRHLRIFEYGCGFSTLYYAARVKEVIAVEHSLKWSQWLAPKVQSGARIIRRDPGPGYIREILKHGEFDVVIIDGLNREECAEVALEALSPSGVIVWDDAERYRAAELLCPLGFREMPFWGMSPIVIHESCTSVFYRPGNCLGV